MDQKSNLRNLRTYKNVFVEHDVPAFQRMLQSNLKTIVGALGHGKLEVKGTRVY